MSTRMMVCLAVALAIVSAWLGAAAADSGALAFFEQAGLRKQMESAKEVEAQVTKAAVQQMTLQMRQQLVLPESAAREIEALSLEMAEAVNNAYTVQELLEVYAAPFDRAYPEGFGDEAKLFATPEGQRFITTLNEATAATYAFRSQRQQEVMNRETQKFVARARALAVPRAP